MRQKVTIIAEVGQAHDGSLGILHSFIDTVADCGVDIIKFQTHIADAESSEFEPFRKKFSYVDSRRIDYWRRMEFTPDQWAGIKKHCEDVNLEFLSTPFSLAAVNLLTNLGMRRFKVGSGETSNLLLLEKIARTGREILLSTGMSSYAEIGTAIDFLKKFNNPLAVFQCTTKYPSPPESVGLNVIPELRRRFGLRVGLSDHSGTIFPSLAAVTLGAIYIEVHVTFDKRMFGPDSTSSLTIAELKSLVEGIRYLETSMANPVDKDQNQEYDSTRKIFGKSLAVNRDLPIGHVLQLDDLETKKPADRGIAASDYPSVIGRRLTKLKRKYDFLNLEDFA